MVIIQPSVKMLNLSSRDEGIAMLKFIEYCGRISHRSEDAVTEDSWQRFIKAVVIDKGDWSITEHSMISVEFEVDRGVTHELVRHRLASYTQESTRFVNYEKKMPPRFILPVLSDDSTSWWESAIRSIEESYKRMIALGVAPQIARSILPNALASKIVMTCNLRNWRHFLIMRTTKETHPQMKQVTIRLLKMFQDRVPLLFDDIGEDKRQIDNLKGLAR